MARQRYDGEYGYGLRGYRMDPGWQWDENSSDPNWRGGGYRGQRMDLGPHHERAAYGWYREGHAADLGGHGGFDGRYDLQPGRFDGQGIYHEQAERRPHQPWPRYDGDFNPRGETGGVRGDARYLRQYNAYSPALDPRTGGGPDARGYGFAPGPDEPRMLGRDDARDHRLREHSHQGYNTGGFSEGKYPGPGTRQSRPNR